MAVTLVQIAELAGTHPSTVSLVLNGRRLHRVSPETRERIERIANELGYRVNRSAQGLVRGSTKTIALLLNDLSNPFFAKYVSLLESRFQKHGYHVMPFETRADDGRESELMTLHRQGVCDLVMSLGHYNHANDDALEKTPVVVRFSDWGGRVGRLSKLPHVAVEHLRAFQALIDHFVASGRSRLGLVLHENNQPFNKSESRSRYARAIADVIKASTLICGESTQVAVHESRPLKDWYDAAYSLLSRETQIDALLVHTTEQVAPVIEAARRLGRRIGPDLALATFDDPPIASWLEGGLTVIREPAEPVADALVECALAVLKGKKKPVHTMIQSELVIRASTQTK